MATQPSPFSSATGRALVALAVLCWCAGASLAAAPEPMAVAIALPLSGPHAELGHAIRTAVELALDAARRKNGGAAPAISLTYIDDRCSSEGGLAAAQAITADPAARPLAVIGHACPSAAEAAGPVYDKAGVVFITAGSLPTREPRTHRFGPLHFRLPADSDQGVLIGAALVAAGPEARIAFVRDRTAFAQATLSPAAAALAARGRAVLAVETFAGGEKDFSAIAARLQAAGISHIALAAFPSEAALLVAVLREARPGVTIYATDPLADPVFAKLAGAAADGVQVALAPDVAAFPKAHDVAAALAARGVAPSRAALATYAAVEVIAATAAGLTTADAAAKVLATREFTTILGPLRFDAAGAANVPSHVFYTWRAGHLLPPAW